jgi:hypothetical protein
VNISQDRAAGAADAGDQTWMNQQVAAYLHYKRQLGTALLAQATAIENWLATNPPGLDGTESLEVVIQKQARLASTGFTAEEKAGIQRFGTTDEQLEQLRQDIIAANPVDLMTSLRQDYLEMVVNLRDYGTLLTAPDPWFSQQIGGVSAQDTSGTTANLALAGQIVETIEVGNPTASTATIDLRIRRLGMPANWSATVEPSVLSNLPAGEHRTVTVLIAPPPAAPQGAVIKVAVEGYIGSTLVGGVEFQVTVPSYARFANTFVRLPFVTRR